VSCNYFWKIFKIWKIHCWGLVVYWKMKKHQQQNAVNISYNDSNNKQFKWFRSKMLWIIKCIFKLFVWPNKVDFLSKIKLIKVFFFVSFNIIWTSDHFESMQFKWLWCFYLFTVTMITINSLISWNFKCTCTQGKRVNGFNCMHFKSNHWFLWSIACVRSRLNVILV
jgi:hypothetical protein